MNVEDLKYFDYSTNKMDPETYERIKKDVEKNGFLDPLIFFSGDEIVSGNHRVKIARELGKTNELKLIDLGILSKEDKFSKSEMFNTRGIPEASKRCLILSHLYEEALKRGDDEDTIYTNLSLKMGYSIPLVRRNVKIGESIINDFPQLIEKVSDTGPIRLLHAHYLTNLNSRRVGKGATFTKEEKHETVNKVVSILESEFEKRGKPVAADKTQALLRKAIVETLGKSVLPLTDVPWASIWYPERRVETIRHIVEENAELGTYKRDWRAPINRLTRVSSFHMSIAFNLYRLLIPKGERWTIVDPFCGYGIRGIVGSYMNHEVSSYDVSPNMIDKVKKLWFNIWPEKEGGKWESIENVFKVNDSRVLPHANDSVDLVFTSPPYWTLEKYEDVEGQLSSIKSYDEFLENLKVCIEEMKRVCKVGGYITIVVENFRDNSGTSNYVPFTFDVYNILSSTPNFKIWDHIILGHDVSKPGGGTKSIINHHTRSAHEDMLIFKKL